MSLCCPLPKKINKKKNEKEKKVKKSPSSRKTILQSRSIEDARSTVIGATGYPDVSLHSSLTTLPASASRVPGSSDTSSARSYSNADGQPSYGSQFPRVSSTPSIQPISKQMENSKVQPTSLKCDVGAVHTDVEQRSPQTALSHNLCETKNDDIALKNHNQRKGHEGKAQHEEMARKDLEIQPLKFKIER